MFLVIFSFLGKNRKIPKAPEKILCSLESPSKIRVGWCLHHGVNVSFWGNGKAMKLGDSKNLKINEIEERLLVEKKYTKRQNNDTLMT